MQHVLPTRRPLSGLLAVALLVMLVFASCGGAPAATPPTAGPAAQTEGQPKIPIKLAENPWTGSSMNVNVARILLEEQLGYKVELVTIDENAQWPALASGDLSASLEVWPSGHAESIKQFITDKKVVEDLGPLGVVGKISWYVPSYVIKGHPDLATWEGFTKPENAALFKTAETGDKGQFLAGDPSWVQYDEDIIKNLDLPLQVVKSGSEQAVLAALDAAYNRQQPILFYFWTPHSIHSKYELTPVKLPEHTDACYAKAEEGSVACDYPEDVLFKVAWAGLKEKAPEAYTLLKNMKYTNQDQIGMMAAVELEKKTPEQAARDWIQKNENIWKAWLPAR